MGNHMDDGVLSRMLADESGGALLEVQRAAGPDELGSAELKSRADRTSQDLLAALLAQHRPGDAVLSEEARDDPARLTAERVWIIDPLDGTREFAEGREDWAVHVALWERGELVAGAVALPRLSMTLADDADKKSWARPHPIRIAVSRTRPAPLVTAVAEALKAEVVPMGSAGFKACAVARGQVDAYLHAGGQYEWDSAAPVAVTRAAGLFASRLDGSPLAYNSADPYLPDLMICNPTLTEEILAAVRDQQEVPS